VAVLELAARPGFRIFLLLWAGQLVSAVGSGLTTFTLGVYVYQQTGSAAQFTFVYLCGALPVALTLPLAGALADRWNLRRLMMTASAGAGLTKLALVALLYTRELEVWHVYVTAAAVSAFASLQGIPYTVLVTLLVPREHYGRASGMVQTAQAAAQIFPPALGAFLLGHINLRGVILLDVATYLVAIAALLAVRVPRRAAEAGAAPGGGAPARSRGLAYGWTFIRERPGLLGLLVYFAAVNLVVSGSTVLMTPLVLSLAGHEALGAVLSASGVSFLLGSVLMSVWGGPRRRVGGVLAFGCLFGACSVLVGLRPSVALIAAGACGMYFVLPVVNGCSQAVWQSKTPLEVQGRVFAVRRLIAASTVPVGYLLSGPLAERVFEPLVGEGRGRGIALMFVVAGALTMLAQACGYLYPRLRRLEEELPDAQTPAAAGPSS
jgi:DHA3 family macrolide efflux protein-like MFS transporter